MKLLLLVLLFAGDAMQHQMQIDNAYRNGSYDYSSYFQHLQTEISQADIAVVNLEVTLGGKPYRGYPAFSAPDEFAVALKSAGFDVFLNANNHILDRSSKGLCRTLHVLDSLDVKHTGVFRNEKERAEHYPLMLNVKGIRIAFLNYTYGTNGITAPPPVIVNYMDTAQIRQDIQAAHLQRADLIIANMHWGDEYKLAANKTQEKMAQFLITNGVDIVMGSHPHVVQPTQLMTDSTGKMTNIVVYSLGNFVSGMTAVNTDGGQLIKITLTKQWWSKPLISACESSLIYVARMKNGAKTDYSVIPVAAADSIGLDENNRARMDRFVKPLIKK